MDGRRIYCLEAITKDKADEGAKEKKEKKSKDSRNLYLAREGLVREGTLAAEGVSKVRTVLKIVGFASVQYVVG